MPSRREFIQAGLAVSVAPVAVPLRASASGLPPAGAAMRVHPLYCVVCDVRFPSGVDLAREVGRLGVTVVEISGDITDFWFNDLSIRWKQAPIAVAGLTAPGPLFCLERFGWDHGLRVAFHGTHRFLDARRVEHVLSGPPRTIAAARRVALTGADWACHVARLLSRCAIAPGRSTTTVRGEGTHGPVNEYDRLVSWVIAPKPVPNGQPPG